MTTPLPLPDDPRLPELVALWPDPSRWPFRSRWLRDFEGILRQWFPHASSRELSVTARHAAPFFLAQGHDVP